MPSQESTGVRPRRKRGEGEDVCRACKSGTCRSNCKFRHDTDESEVEPHRPNPPVSEGSLTASGLSAAGASRASKRNAKRIHVQGGDTVARERADTMVRQEVAKSVEQVGYIQRKLVNEAAAREEAARTISQVVFGSIVTYGAGLDVLKLITGFETCTIRFTNLPPDVKEEGIHALLTDQGIDVENLHLTLEEKPDHGPEVRIVTDIAGGQGIASSLDGIKFRDEPLFVDISAANSFDGMNATAGQGSDILTISWRAPSARYVAEYIDIAAAKAKVREFKHFIYSGRRIKVEMNTHPPGYRIRNLQTNAIQINNLPPDVTDEDVVKFTKSLSAERLRIKGTFAGAHPIEEVARLVRNDIEQAVPKGFLKFDDPPSTSNPDGIVSTRAYFSSWDEAHTAFTHLSGQRYGQQSVWLQLPNPTNFTLLIPIEQYRAQKSQWDSLLDSTKDQQACILHIRESGNVVHIQLSGSVKEVTGAMKVRVENLARGDKVEGWHRLLGIPGNPFVSRVFTETGAYLRIDLQRQSVKVYGEPKAVIRACEMIRNELAKLASLDYAITLARSSVGFFVREGLQQLKETLGEDNVRFDASSRKITVSGSEEAQHALEQLVKRSHEGTSSLSDARRGKQFCPICYDDISSPHRLGCGHKYCVACLRYYISSASESDQLPLLCLGDEAQCNIPIPIPTIQHFVPPATFNRLLETAFDAYITNHPERYKHCNTPDCMQIYCAAQVGAIPQTLQCPSCFSAVCNACHDDAHDSLTCAQSRETRHPSEQARMDAWIISQEGRVKKCPQCTVPIEKTEGCNHVTCRCGAHICWQCLGVYTDRTIYAHMNEVHGVIYDGVPDAPWRVGQQVVDYEDVQEELEQHHTDDSDDSDVPDDPDDPDYFGDSGYFDDSDDELLGGGSDCPGCRLAKERRQREAEEEQRRLLEQRQQQEVEAREKRRLEQRQQQQAEEQRRGQEAEAEKRRFAELRRQQEVEEQRQRQEAEAEERRCAELRRQQEVEEQRRWQEAEAEKRRCAELRRQQEVEQCRWQELRRQQKVEQRRWQELCRQQEVEEQRRWQEAEAEKRRCTELRRQQEVEEQRRWQEVEAEKRRRAELRRQQEVEELRRWQEAEAKKRRRAELRQQQEMEEQRRRQEAEVEKRRRTEQRRQQEAEEQCRRQVAERERLATQHSRLMEERRQAEAEEQARQHAEEAQRVRQQATQWERQVAQRRRQWEVEEEARRHAELQRMLMDDLQAEALARGPPGNGECGCTISRIFFWSATLVCLCYLYRHIFHHRGA